MTSYINAYSPTRNGDRIELRATDLIFSSIDNIFVYPFLDIDRLQNALSHTLSLWPILTGRILIKNDQEYFIEFSNNSIPFTYIENDQLERWPDLPVVVDDDMNILQSFIDSVQYKPEKEPLIRLKITRLIRSNEYILDTSFSHLVGDADSNIHFLQDLSQIYQQLEPSLPRPVFQRHVLHNEKIDFSIPLIKEIYEKAQKKETIFTRLSKENFETEPINICFSSKQLIQLYAITKCNNQITIHDALCAYIILTMNKYLFIKKDEYIQRARIVCNYRGICPLLAPIGHIANSIMTIVTYDFSDHLSLSNIAKTIRKSINEIRNEDYLSKWIVSSDILTKQLIKDNRMNFVFDTNEIYINSNFKYDWANQVDFGMKNQCRFHTVKLYKFYIKIFHLNPIQQKDGSWIRDNNGVEVSFRIPKGEMKENFLKAWKKDIEENFSNIKETFINLYILKSIIFDLFGKI